MSTLRVVPPGPPASLVEQVAAEVRAYVARAQLTQVQLASILGVPQTSVSKRLRGKVPFRIDELERLAGVLGVHPATFLGVPTNQPLPPSPSTGRYPTRRHTTRSRSATTLVHLAAPAVRVAA